MIIVAFFFFFWWVINLLIAFLTTALHFSNSSFSFAYFRLSTIYIPKFLAPFANFDGEYYLHIAHEGYQRAEHAYFPLYPLFVYIFTPIFHLGYFYAGFIISNVSFLIGLYFFKKYLELIGKKPQTILWIFLFLLTFPTSFFFGATYTEGLFFLLIALIFYFAQKRFYGGLVIAAILASLTKLIGVFLFIPILAILLANTKNLQFKRNALKNNMQTFFQFIVVNKKKILISFSPFLGLIAYMIFLFFRTGDFLAFYHEQADFNNGRSVSKLILLPQVYYRYIKILATASHDVTYFISCVEFGIFTLFLVVILYDLWLLLKQKYTPEKTGLLGLNLFSLINMILPSLTGTLSSTPRYLLFSFSFFLRIAEIKNIGIRIAFLILFIIFHVILLSLFIQGYFVS